MKRQMAKTMRPFSLSKGAAAAMRRRQRQMPPLDKRRRGRLRGERQGSADAMGLRLSL